ncbi:hypothetical protein OQ968_10910 [Mycobacterium sp. 663a-19]|nr:hypothetical protein [Mycobacterium sp. 663a-19]
MQDSDNDFPDDVPVADAVDQHRPTSDLPDEDDDAASWEDDGDVPLEAAASDWQEQRETVLIDPEFDEPEQYE